MKASEMVVDLKLDVKQTWLTLLKVWIVTRALSRAAAAGERFNLAIERNRQL